jgi:hypothetical protein
MSNDDEVRGIEFGAVTPEAMKVSEKKPVTEAKTLADKARKKAKRREQIKKSMPSIKALTKDRRAEAREASEASESSSADTITPMDRAFANITSSFQS